MNHQLTIEHYNNGLQYAKEGKWDEAIEFLSKAITENPEHVNSYNVLGKVYIQKDDVNAARKCWRKVSKIDPDNATARQCLAKIGKGFDQIHARKLLWSAIIAISLAALIITSFIFLRRIGDLKAKLTTVTTTQKIQQNKPATMTGEIYVQPTILLRLETDSQVTEAYTQALADCRSGHYDQAIEVFQQILRYSQPHQLKDNAQYWLGECYYAQQKYDQALEEYQKIKRLFPQANKVFDAELKIAYSYYNLGSIEEARQQLLQLSKDWPQQQYRSRLAPLTKAIQSGQTD